MSEAVNKGNRLAKQAQRPDITLDMLHAYIDLARTLNITETADNLNVTRQTVRRHISALEEMLGGRLFDLSRRSYVLSKLGRTSLAGASSLLRQADLWSRRAITQTHHSQYLEYARVSDAKGHTFIAHQYPLNAISMLGSPIVKQTFSAWGAATAQIESSAFSKARPYLVLYRRCEDGWICVEVGGESAYSKWFGWKWSKSAVGKLSQEDNAGDDFNSFIAEAYERIHGEGGARFDHMFAHLPRETSDDLVPVTFQRLLLGCVFPDGSPALAVLVDITGDVSIDEISLEEKRGASKVVREFCSANHGAAS